MSLFLVTVQNHNNEIHNLKVLVLVFLAGSISINLLIVSSMVFFISFVYSNFILNGVNSTAQLFTLAFNVFFSKNFCQDKQSLKCYNFILQNNMSISYTYIWHMPLLSELPKSIGFL